VDERISKTRLTQLEDLRVWFLGRLQYTGNRIQLLNQFATGKADLLIGTQMIAKGLHFPEVTLVGILNGEAGLHIPDFRAAESTFQIITQVAGRSGRGELPGEVIIQSMLPDNPVIGYAAQQDYTAFYEAEIALREMFDYPPFKQMAKFVFSGEEPKPVEHHAGIWREALIHSLPSTFEFLPIVPCGYAKIKNLFRFQFLIKCPSLLPLNRALQLAREKIPPCKKVKVSIDINPSSTFF